MPVRFDIKRREKVSIGSLKPVDRLGQPAQNWLFRRLRPYIGSKKRANHPKRRWTTVHAHMKTQTEPSKKWGRFGDVQSIYSIRRSKAYELISAGLVKSAVIKQKGARSGVRLIDMKSVEDFLRANTV